MRAPNNNRRDRLLASYSRQIEVFFDSLGLEEKKVHSTAGERIAGLLAQIAQFAPLMVELYRFKTLDSFKMLLGDSGIDLLAARSIIVVAANLPQTGKPAHVYWDHDLPSNPFLVLLRWRSQKVLYSQKEFRLISR
ncbi:hypothetical protein [Polynucleobacter necessarius]|uniref:hypothetical protein n=1 Tax=Polynucleobacter necessarius TaxID=576610 RepID=UPI001E3BEE88|nr:hypothetical protein [Polynucleobacter necessarius]